MATTNDLIPTIDVFVDKFRHLSPEEQATLLDKLAETRKEKTIDDLFGCWQSDDPKEQAKYDRMTQAILHARDLPDVVYFPEPEVLMSLEELAGSWKDDRSAEEIVEDIRRSRTPNRDRVNL